MEALVPLLEGLFTETDPEKRAKIEASLDEVAREPDKFFSLLLQVVATPLLGDPKSLPLSLNTDLEVKSVKQAAISLLQNMIKKITQESLITPEAIVMYVKAILEVAAAGLESQIAEQLSLALSLLIFSANKPTATYHHGVMEAVLPVFSTALKQTESLPNFGVVLACMSNTLILFSSHPELIKPLVDLLSLIDPPILNTLAQLIALTKTVAENGGEKFSSTASEMLRQITTLTIWAEMSMEIFERGVKHNPQVGTYFIGSTGLANILIQSVQVVACVGSQQPESLLSSTGSNEFDTALNSLKEKCLEIGNSVLEHIHSTPASGKMPHLPLYSYCLTICPKAILTLAVVCVKEYDKLEERVTEETTSKVVVRLLRLLSDLVEDNNFYNTFNLNKHNIIIDIALVLLRTTQKEMKSIKTDPQNFVNLAIDTCEKQESETPKTEAAKLLEALCDHIDGCLSFTSIFCCESIKYACAGCNPEILVNFPMLSQFRNTSVFLSKSTPELIIETSIVVMADISYLTPKRKDIFAMFENALAENCVTLFDSSSILIKCRLALMMGYYADNLFTGKMDLFVKMIEFLLQGISMENEVKVLALQCADTLKTAIGDSDLVSRLDAFINKLFPTLCAMVGHIELPSFYEILMTIIGCYASSIDESLINLLQSLVSRVEKEYKDLRAKGERNNMTINQCWNVIRAISEQKAFFPAYLDSIEAALLPMFNYLVDPTHVEFDDDMIQVITALITRRGGISDNMAKIFPYLPNFFEKYGQTFGSLFQTLNAYIFYGKDVFAANKAWIELIIKLSVSSLFTTKETVTLNNTEGAILAQVLLQSIGNGVLDLYIPIILEQVVKRLNMPPSADYLSRELYNAILCSVCNNAQVTLGKLEALGSTETVFSGLFENAGKYQATYDVKVLVIGLSNLLIQSSLPPYLTSAQPKILDAIVSTLQRQAAKDAKTLLKADKKALALDQEDESENSSSEDEMEDNEEDEEKVVGLSEEDSEEDGMPKNAQEDINMTLSTLQGQIKKIDEYEYFGKVMKSIYAVNAERAKVLVQSLAELQQNYLKSILQSKRVIIQKKGERTTVARRILKPKIGKTGGSPPMQ